MRNRVFLYAFFGLLFFLPSGHARSNTLVILQIGQELQDELDQANNIVDNINFVEEAVNDLRAGRTPAARDETWRNVVADAEAFGRSVTNLEYTSRFDAVRYTTSIDEYMACTSRAASHRTLEERITELQAGVTSGREIDKKLEDTKTRLTAARESAISLARQSAQLAAFNDTFAWDWYDLETKVAPALAGAVSHIDTRRTRLTAERNLIETKLNNLTGNLGDLARTDCSIAGTWDGRWVEAFTSETGSWTLDLVKSRNDYTCTRTNSSGRQSSCCLTNVSPARRQVTLRTTCRNQRSCSVFCTDPNNPSTCSNRCYDQTYWEFDLTLSDDYKSMTGTERYFPPTSTRRYTHTLIKR